MKKTQGATFDPAEQLIYFIATQPSDEGFLETVHPYLLVGINEIKGRRQLDVLNRWCDSGVKLFLDSGIFNLTMTHARKHNTTMNEALALAPEEIDGFDELFDRYLYVIEVLGERSWGYTELDQGGRECKIRMRAKLEAMGLRPMPVYHPINDGAAYFDTLAAEYDRIAFGNVVQAAPSSRIRLMATAWERRRAYPHLWIHLLGVTPSPLTIAFPSSSCDSSTWLSGRRWGHNIETAMTRPVGTLTQRLLSASGAADLTSQNTTALRLGAMQASLLMQNTRDSLAALGATP